MSEDRGYSGSQEDREVFVRENAVALIADRDALIERQRRRLAQVERSVAVHRQGRGALKRAVAHALAEIATEEPLEDVTRILVDVLAEDRRLADDAEKILGGKPGRSPRIATGDDETERGAALSAPESGEPKSPPPSGSVEKENSTHD